MVRSLGSQRLPNDVRDHLTLARGLPMLLSGFSQCRAVKLWRISQLNLIGKSWNSRKYQLILVGLEILTSNWTILMVQLEVSGPANGPDISGPRMKNY